jgi:hypothetical protein
LATKCCRSGDFDDVHTTSDHPVTHGDIATHFCFPLAPITTMVRNDVNENHLEVPSFLFGLLGRKALKSDSSKDKAAMEKLAGEIGSI